MTSKLLIAYLKLVECTAGRPVSVVLDIDNELPELVAVSTATDLATDKLIAVLHFN
jgi:hypothetical protein